MQHLCPTCLIFIDGKADIGRSWKVQLQRARLLLAHRRPNALNRRLNAKRRALLQTAERSARAELVFGRTKYTPLGLAIRTLGRPLGTEADGVGHCMMWPRTDLLVGNG